MRHLLLCVVFGTILIQPAREAAGQAPRTDTFGDPLPEGAIARFGTVRLRPGEPVLDVAFIADGKQLAVATGKGGVQIWDARDGRWLHNLPGSERLALTIMAVSPDRKWLAAGAMSGDIWLWSLAEEAKPPRQLQSHNTPLGSLAFSPDSASLISLSNFGMAKYLNSDGHTSAWEIRLWNVSAGTFVSFLRKDVLREDRDYFFCAAFGATSQQILTAGYERLITKWDIQTQKTIQQYETKLREIDKLTMDSANQAVFALVGIRGDQWLQRWDATNGELLAAWPTRPNIVFTFALSQDCQWIAMGAEDAVHVCDANTGRLVTKLPTPRGTAAALAFSPGGKSLAAAIGNGVALWDVPTGKELTKDAPLGLPDLVRILPDNKTLFADYDGSWIQQVDILTGKVIHEYRHSDPDKRCTTDLSPDGTILAVGRPDLGGLLLNATTGKVQAVWTSMLTENAALRSNPAALAFSPDGAKLAVARGSHSRFEYQHGGFGGGFEGLGGGGFGFGGGGVDPTIKGMMEQFGAKGGFGGGIGNKGGLQFGGGKGGGGAGYYPPPKNLQFLDVKSGNTALRLAHSGSGVDRLVFSADSQKLEVSDTGGIRTLDVSTGRTLDTVLGKSFYFPDKRRLGMALSPETEKSGLKLVIPGSTVPDRILPISPHEHFFTLAPKGDCALFVGKEPGNEYATLRCLNSGKCLARLAAHRGGVVTASFSADGKYLVTGGRDTAILIWDIADLLKAKRRSVVLSTAELERFWSDLGYQELETAFPAMDRLVESPAAALALVRKYVHQVSTVQLSACLATLASDSYAKREKASSDLTRMEFAAVEPLRQALAGGPTLEFRIRVQGILKAIGEPTRAAHVLASWRAVSVLEQINTPESRDYLEELAKGQPRRV